MVDTDLLQSYGCLAVLQLGNETPVLVFRFQHLAACLKAGVKARHFLPEIIQRTFKEVIGYKEVLFHIALFDAITGFTRQNYQFADYILAAKVDTRVWFGITFLLSHLNGLAERNIRAYLVEDIIQCTAQHGFNLQYLVAAMDKVVNGIDDGQACADVCLKQIFHTALAGYLLQLTIVFVFRRSGNLIGGNYRYVVHQKVFIQGSHSRARRTIHEYGVKDVHADNLVTERIQRTVLAFLRQLFTETSQVKALTTEHGFGRIGNAYHIQLQTVLLHQLLTLAVNLFYQTAAYRANTAYKEVQHLIFRQEERIMDNIQGLAQRLAVHHKRNIRFRSALCTGYHIDTVTSQRTEQLTGNTRCMLHVLANDSHRSQIFFRLYGRNLSHLNLFGELLVQHFASQVGIRITHTDGSRVLRRCL